MTEIQNEPIRTDVQRTLDDRLARLEKLADGAEPELRDPLELAILYVHIERFSAYHGRPLELRIRPGVELIVTDTAREKIIRFTGDNILYRATATLDVAIKAGYIP